MLSNPAIALEEREALVEKALSKAVSRPVLNLILLMLRGDGSSSCHGSRRSSAGSTTSARASPRPARPAAAELTPAELEALTNKLEQFTGGRVELDVAVDPSLLGGLVVRVGDRLIDVSVRGRLERLRNQLVSGAL